MNNALPPLNLDQRTQNCLFGAGITSLEHLLTQTENELLKIPNFGAKSLILLRAELQKNGLSLYVKTEKDTLIADLELKVALCQRKLRNAEAALEVAKMDLRSSQEQLDQVLAG